MTWDDAKTVLYGAVRQTAKPLPLDFWNNRPDFHSRAQLLFELEARLKPQLISVSLAFAERGELPDLAPGDLNFLWGNRLMCALDTLEILMIEPGPGLVSPVGNPFPRANTRAIVLRWLLIGSWTHRCETYLKLSALRSLAKGSETFYGLPKSNPEFGGN